MSANCMRCVISGRVQGVWFRAATRQQAQTLGISGWVRNLSDGRVELVACGAQAALANFNTWLKRGPELARVTAVECEPMTAQAFTDFEIR